jgi:hypothetical protein
MAIRTDFTAGEVLAAADLNDTFAAKANLASPTFTGTPAAPTAAAGTNTTQLATTAFVRSNAGLILNTNIFRAIVDTEQLTPSDTYTDLTTVGPSITATTGTAVMILMSAQAVNDGGSGRQSSITLAVSGATTITASDIYAMVTSSASGALFQTTTRAWYIDTLTPGSNTFTLKYKTQGSPNTSYFKFRSLVIARMN